jgi:hypothetical protein
MRTSSEGAASDTLASNAVNKDIVWARKYLKDGLQIPIERELTNMRLASTLLHLSRVENTPLTVHDGLQAIALTLEQNEAENIVSLMVSAVTEQLNKILQDGQVDDAAGNTPAERMRSAAVCLTNTVQETCEQIQRVMEHLSTATETNGLSEDVRPTVEPRRPLTFAEAVRQAPPPPGHMAAVMRGRNMLRQIVIDKAPNSDGGGLSGLSEKEAVAKANLALTSLSGEAMPKGAVFVGAAKLHNGSILLQTDSEETATWLKRGEVTKQFVDNLGGTSVFKPRQLQTVVEFVPVAFDPETAGALRGVEAASGLALGSISSARYFKPAHRRTPRQTTAHMMMGFASHDAANHAIEHGIFVKAKHIFVRKLLQEPKRCVKCQSLDGKHIASECTFTHDVCG